MMLWDLGFVGHVVELLKWKSIKNFDDSFFFLFWQNEPFRSSFIHTIRFLFMPLSFSLPLSLNALLRSLSLTHARHLSHFSTLSPRLLEFLYANSRFLTFSLYLSLAYSSLTPIESFVSRIYFAATGPILILCLRSLWTQKTQKSRNSNQKFDANFETLDILKFKYKKYFFGRSAKAKKNFHKNRFKIGISKSTANKSQRE